MATHTWVDLHMPEASLLADLNGIVGDLQKAREYAEMMVQAQLGGPSHNMLLVEPLCIAMTVTYARVFSSGVRHSLQETDLHGLSETQRETHQFLRDFRDKHVAHSVNEFEENSARACYCVERLHDEGFTSIGYGGGRIASIGGDFVHGLIEITRLLETHVRKQIAVEEQKLLSTVRAMPIKEVLDQGQKVFRPSLSKVAERRKKISDKSPRLKSGGDV
ncbi:MAG: hypothetical protein U1E04_01035 [Hylemonella sp.]|nr:hypothetical protein [Hylemonella sp.]